MQTYDVTIWWSVNNQLWQYDDQFKKNTTLNLTGNHGNPCLEKP